MWNWAIFIVKSKYCAKSWKRDIIVGRQLARFSLTKERPTLYRHYSIVRLWDTRFKKNFFRRPCMPDSLSAAARIPDSWLLTQLQDWWTLFQTAHTRSTRTVISDVFRETPTILENGRESKMAQIPTQSVRLEPNGRKWSTFECLPPFGPDERWPRIEMANNRRRQWILRWFIHEIPFR